MYMYEYVDIYVLVMVRYVIIYYRTCSPLGAVYIHNKRIECTKLFLFRGSPIVMILSLTGRGISVSFVTISFLIAKPTPASLLSPSGLQLQ